jgi:hypothetical protein
MSSHVIGFVLTISADEFALAARLLGGGSPSANPVAFALAKQTSFELSDYRPAQFAVRDLRTGQRYIGQVPADLAEYMARFQRGELVSDNCVFELALSSDD